MAARDNPAAEWQLHREALDFVDQRLAEWHAGGAIRDGQYRDLRADYDTLRQRWQGLVTAP